ASQQRAFEVFTRRIGEWWPRSHKIGLEPLKSAILEPRAGGRWYEIGEGGAECEWGRVLSWEEPSRVVLAWQIGADWKFDPGLVTEVEIRFIAESERRTRVELEHRNLERFGAAAETVRTAIGSPDGWTGVLKRFAERVASLREDR